MIIYQVQPRLFQAVQWLHWRKLNQTCGDRRKRRSCLVVTMLVKFNNSFLQSCISNLEGPLASSLLGHEFHSDSMFPNSGPVLRCIYVLRHWHWIQLLRFGGRNSGLRLWNYDLHFEILLLFGGKDSGMEIWNLDPPYYPVHIIVEYCRDMHRFSHCLLWTCCIPLRDKVHEGARYSSLLFLRINMAHHESRIGTGKCEPQSHGQDRTTGELCILDTARSTVMNYCWNVLVKRVVNLNVCCPPCMKSTCRTSIDTFFVEKVDHNIQYKLIWNHRLCDSSYSLAILHFRARLKIYSFMVNNHLI